MRKLLALLMAAVLLLPLAAVGDSGWVTQERSVLVQPGAFGSCRAHPGAMIRLVYNDAWQAVDEGGHMFFTECKGYCTDCGTVVCQDVVPAVYESHALEGGQCVCGYSRSIWAPGVPDDSRADDVWDPDPARERYFSFSTGVFDFGEVLNKPVYSGPGTGYLRGADGKSQFISRNFSYGGLEGDWMLVRCSVRTGTRYGYINVREYRDQLQGIPRLDFAWLGADITRDTALWDSMMQATMGPLGYLRQGTRVTYLSTFVGKEMTLAYVEATVNGKKARGFVDPACIRLEGGW